MRTPQEEGQKWESDFSNMMQSAMQIGSGNQWHSKLDVKGKGILWSCKWTGEPWQPITYKLWREAVAATDGLSGTGADPGLACRSESEDLITLRLSTFLSLITSPPVIQASKVANRIASTDVPLLLREK